MKRETEIKEILIQNAIHLIAQGGFEKATTKELTYCGGDTPDFKMNEVYIYRIFGSKERLYEATFYCLDRELVSAFKNGVAAVGGFDSADPKKLYEFFLMAWSFIMKNEERCRCYVRYYYSVYFKGESLLAHKKHFADVKESMGAMFKEEADTDAILHSVFITFFSFGIRVYNGELEDSEINRSHIFNVLYCMMATYFKDSVKLSRFV